MGGQETERKPGWVPADTAVEAEPHQLSSAVVSSGPEVSRVVLQANASAFVLWYSRSLMEFMGEISILVLSGGLQR
nr:unnamed protein product [Digitaria exilis]